MSKANFCINGTSVTNQVILYQKTHKSDDFFPILLYYDNYKEVWFNQLADYMDRSTFDAEYDYKLMRAVDSFNPNEAQKISEDRGLSELGNFNRWFYKILTNWKSNVKATRFRLKKWPSVTCPICGRQVARIDEEHLKHLIQTKDLPSVFSYKNDIYDVYCEPGVYATCWGKNTTQKMNNLLNNQTKQYSSEKRRVRWPWRLKNGERGVWCPFTKKVVPRIDNEYLAELPDKYNRYAEPTDWDIFVKEHPSALIQSELYSLDNESKDNQLKDYICSDKRFSGSQKCIDYDSLQTGKYDQHFEHAFSIIDKFVKRKNDRTILKLIAAGYSSEDICDTLKIAKRDLTETINIIKDNEDLRKTLEGSICQL